MSPFVEKSYLESVAGDGPLWSVRHYDLVTVGHSIESHSDGTQATNHPFSNSNRQLLLKKRCPYHIIWVSSDI